MPLEALDISRLEVLFEFAGTSNSSGLTTELTTIGAKF